MAKKFYNTFSFTGEIMLPKDADKLVVDHEPFASGWKKKSLKIGVKESKSNGTFVNIDAMIPPTESYEMEKLGVSDGKKIKFKYSDRNKSVVADNVADFTKFIVDLEDDMDKKKERIGLQMKIRNINDRETITDEDKTKLAQYTQELVEKSDKLHKFVHEVDFINFIKENIEVLKAHKIRVSGNYTKSTYKGKYYTNYAANKVELVDGESKNELRISVDYYFDKDAIDEADFKIDKKITLSGYVKSRDNVAKADKYFPQQVVLDASKLDLENEKHVARFNFVKDTFKVKGKNVFHIPVEVVLQKGAEQVEFTIDMLEERHKTQVLLGLKKLDDYKPKGGYVYGDSVEYFRFAKLLDTDYPDGAEDTEVSIKEFEDLVGVSSADVKAADVVKPEKVVEVETTKDDLDEDIDSLFA